MVPEASEGPVPLAAGCVVLADDGEIVYIVLAGVVPSCQDIQVLYGMPAQGALFACGVERLLNAVLAKLMATGEAHRLLQEFVANGAFDIFQIASRAPLELIHLEQLPLIRKLLGLP